jgi:hypothetical protein
MYAEVKKDEQGVDFLHIVHEGQVFPLPFVLPFPP